ncbi:MAG: hypothetical protein ABSE73_20585, partial [Planctomycetota bacterium]
AREQGAYAELAARILARQGKFFEAILAYRRRAGTEPASEAALLDLANAYYAAASRERAKDAESALPRRLLVEMRRTSRELTVLHPENPKGWELLCRSFRGLEKADSASAEFYRREAEQALQKTLELHKGDRSKLPPDLSSEGV